MRVSGVELPEQTLIAPWMLPAEICERRRATSFSLSMTARRRNTARSITIDNRDHEQKEDRPHSPPSFVEGVGQHLENGHSGSSFDPLS